MCEPHVSSPAALQLAKSIYYTVEQHVTEDSEISRDEAIMAIAQILQELRFDGRNLVVQGTFSHSN